MGRNEGPQTSRADARARLAALCEKKPAKKAAQIRALWPEIQAALDGGHSLKAVCDCLEADGIVMTVQTLGSYVARIRKKSGRIGMVGGQREYKMDRTAEVKDSQGTEFKDPLANVRNRQRKPSGFSYRPELADPKELI